jgi:hypothetical protein
VEEPTTTKSKKGVAGPEYNKEHTHGFFGVKGIVHHEFVPPNTTINSDFYCDVLRCLRKCATKKTGTVAQPQLVPSSRHHDNVPTHMSLKTTEFVNNNNMAIIPHPLYLLDLAPCDFTLFSL